MYEVEASKVASEKAARQDIIDIGFTEVHDHQLVGAKLLSIAASIGIPVDTKLNADFTARLERLRGLSGKAFDNAYIEEMDAIHEADGAAFAKEAELGSHPALRAFAAETVLIVRRHQGSLHALPLENV
jgi:putative membrane protein